VQSRFPAWFSAHERPPFAAGRAVYGGMGGKQVFAVGRPASPAIMHEKI
jgi:hypothetical protein